MLTQLSPTVNPYTVVNGGDHPRPPPAILRGTKMKRKGKMPNKVNKVTFIGSKPECEMILQEIQGDQSMNLGDCLPPAATAHRTTSGVQRPNRGMMQLMRFQFPFLELLVVSSAGYGPTAKKETVLTYASPKIAFHACAALSPKHHDTLAWLGLGKLAEMTLMV
ncbi:hypothetical protein E2562_010549 [Oryza meyeriana var. granulata]|uniref:Uncharacterized protein n=1 Tax=Oryza meyeriana var. granulata TaxID=110450 RepID=A0A6G1BT89_9ORYZ|nr:hypothetical protein E2562_010549 [Oryza meyeriana var. granulata]